MQGKNLSKTFPAETEINKIGDLVQLLQLRVALEGGGAARLQVLVQALAVGPFGRGARPIAP
jgi:hypothetical protein